MIKSVNEEEVYALFRVKGTNSGVFKWEKSIKQVDALSTLLLIIIKEINCDNNKLTTVCR